MGHRVGGIDCIKFILHYLQASSNAIQHNINYLIVSAHKHSNTIFSGRQVTLLETVKQMYMGQSWPTEMTGGRLSQDGCTAIKE